MNEENQNDSPTPPPTPTPPTPPTPHKLPCKAKLPNGEVVTVLKIIGNKAQVRLAASDILIVKLEELELG